jgi:hypothetical protein
MMLAVCSANSAVAGPEAYVISEGVSFISGQFGTMDLGTGAFTAIGPVNPAGYNGVATFGQIVYALDGNNNLDTINPTTGIPTVIGNTGFTAYTFAGNQSGALFGTDVNNNLWSINPTTGAGTFLGPSGLAPLNPGGGFTNSLSVNGGTALYTFQNSTVAPALYDINTTTGAGTVVGPTGSNIVGSGYVGGTLYGFTAFGPESIYTINTATGAATLSLNINQSIFGAATTVPEPSSIVLAGIFMAGALGSTATRVLRRK